MNNFSDELKNDVSSDKIADILIKWMKGSKRPDNGAFIEFKTEGMKILPHIV